MPFKRSRLDSSGNFSLPESESSTNSSSQRTASSSSAAPPPSTPPINFLRPSVLDQSAAATATALVPPAAAQTGGASGSNQARLGEFLEKCFFCKRSISRDRNIFMYRSCAFCREECRDRQISIDDKKGKRQDQAIPNQTAVLVRPQGMNNAEGGHAAGF